MLPDSSLKSSRDVAALTSPPGAENGSAVDRKAAARFQKGLNWLAAGLIVLVATVYLLQTFAGVLQQLLVAVFLVYLVMPPYHWLVRRRVSPLLSGILILAGILIAFSALGVVIGNSVVELEARLPAYEEAVARLINKAAAQFPVLPADALAPWKHGPPLELDQITQLARAALRNLSNFLSRFFVVLVYLLFILAERAGLRQRMKVAFQPERAKQIHELVQRINASITQYLVVKTLMSLLGGVLTWVVLFAFGVDYAVMWGLIAFLFNYIPYLGSFIATVLPVLLSLVQFENPVLTLVILALLLIVQNAIGYLIEPRLAGKRLDLSPLAIILSLAFWGSLWGIVGMILAVPLVVTIKSILEQTAPTQPLARMLSNA
jgi:predicted PurR-regulated permease PerM